MAIVKIECPACGATPQMDADSEFGFCMYCGTRIYIPNAIQRIKGEVSINRDSEIGNLLTRARQYEDRREYKKALEYYDRVLDIDSKNVTAVSGFRRMNLYYEPNFSVSCSYVGKKKSLFAEIEQQGKPIATISHILPGEPQAIRLPIGQYTAVVYSEDGVKGTGTLRINIDTDLTRVNIDCEVKTFTISAVIKCYEKEK